MDIKINLIFKNICMWTNKEIVMYVYVYIYVYINIYKPKSLLLGTEYYNILIHEVKNQQSLKKF